MKSKLERFRIIAGRENVLEPGKELYHSIKGNWNQDYFKRPAPITVELACGRGEYSVQLAERFPELNFIGVDIKGDRIWKGSTWAVEKELTNIGFLRTNILLIDNFFEENEVDEIWLTFPDPRPRKRDIKRRLTSPRFLDLYKGIIKPGGYFRIKTDNTPLYEYSLGVIRERSDVNHLVYTPNVYESDLKEECHAINTRYEDMFSAQGEKIKYIRFSFTN
ncbi:MAG: tRNA (guanosine(46)-N7)-methyltransferase TrmB [Flammeovirgaceae bacterium]|nr:tRNA (guanosine(46)-N7)-methyltransferase TrmB [Flammeovirgaceae bacterium]